MASKQSIADLIVEQLAPARVSTRRMFGEFALYCDGKTVALICDDRLYVKQTPEGRDYVGDVTEGRPFPGAKPWLLIDEDRWEDADWLCALMRLTAKALPAPKAKKKKAVSRAAVRKETAR